MGGKGQITLRTAAMDAAAKSSIFVEITDTGAGISDEDMPSAPQSPKAIAGAISAYLAKCVEIADPEVARFGQLSPTGLLQAQQAKIHMDHKISGPLKQIVEFLYNCIVEARSGYA